MLRTDLQSVTDVSANPPCSGVSICVDLNQAQLLPSYGGNSNCKSSASACEALQSRLAGDQSRQHSQDFSTPPVSKP